MQIQSDSTKSKAWLYYFYTFIHLPMITFGYLLFIRSAIKTTKTYQASLTAIGPLFSRYIYHSLGSRPDQTASDLLKALPNISVNGLHYLFDPTIKAVGLSGYTPPKFQYPMPGPVKLQYLIAERTYFLDQALTQAKNGIKQMVVLGAGFDSRAYGPLKEAKINFFEVDISTTQTLKRKCLERSGTPHKHVNYVSLDFEKEDWFEALIKAGFNPSVKTFFLWEGVSYYLQEHTVAKTLNTVATRSCPGSLLAFDYFSTDYVSGKTLLYKILKHRFKKMGEPLLFGIDTTLSAKKKASDYIQTQGLTLKSYQTYTPHTPEAQKPSFGGIVVAEVPQNPLP